MIGFAGVLAVTINASREHAECSPLKNESYRLITSSGEKTPLMNGIIIRKYLSLI